MQELVEISKIIEALPPWTLIGCVVLAAFGLAAYAIHAVVSVSKGRE